MKRFLIGLLFLAAFGLALAQPPVDYQLSCEIEGELTVIGVVSIVEGNAHVVLLAGVDCYGYLDVTPDGLWVKLEDLGDDAFAVTVWDCDPEAEDDSCAPYGADLITLDEVPQEALKGMLLAQKNRAMAMERRDAAQERAQERGAGMRPDLPEDDELEVDADDGPPEWLELPEPARAPRP